MDASARHRNETEAMHTELIAAVEADDSAAVTRLLLELHAKHGADAHTELVRCAQCAAFVDSSRLEARHNAPILVAAAQLAGPDTVKALIAVGANVHVTCPDGATPLHAGAMASSVKNMELLLSAGANPNQLMDLPRLDGRGTALVYACQGEPGAACDMVELLLKHGARPAGAVTSKDSSIHVLDVAVKRPRPDVDVVRALLRHPGLVDEATDVIRTLVVATTLAPDAIELAHTLLAALGPDPEARDSLGLGQQVFYNALVTHGDVRMLKLLVRYGWRGLPGNGTELAFVACKCHPQTAHDIGRVLLSAGFPTSMVKPGSAAMNCLREAFRCASARQERRNIAEAAKYFMSLFSTASSGPRRVVAGESVVQLLETRQMRRNAHWLARRGLLGLRLLRNTRRARWRAQRTGWRR